MMASMEAGSSDAEAQKRKAIIAIMLDKTLTEEEKARKRQELMMGSWTKAEALKADEKEAAGGVATTSAKPADQGHVSNLDENLKCAICMDLCERPVTAPCQHNFCLACFNKWTNQGKKTCPTCRAGFPSKFAQNPRINTALIVAIRLARNPAKAAAGPAKEQKRVDNEQRPDEAFVTDRAVRAGRANAASGRIMVTTPNDFFGPIEAQHDPERNQGVLVGEFWKDRLDCRQWGAHYPHVAGIAGQSDVGAQSVVLSGGYEDDKDEGEWFLYTGSGGRDLSGNKRTNKEQSFDQEFTKMNKALMLSCTQGLPVRVVRSYKEKRSAYAPSDEQPVRYDGIYRILRCWRKPGIQKMLVCRYLFVRCDNSPAPWSAETGGDSVHLEIPGEAADEMSKAKGKIFEMGTAPYWDWLPDQNRWGWAKPSPTSDKPSGPRHAADPSKKARARLNENEKALKEFKCQACKNTLVQPIRTPCGHNFCKGCLDKKFQDIGDIMAPNAARSLRIRKTIKPCPCCNADICEFLSKAQVNREMSEIITKLQAAVAAAREETERLAAAAAAAGGDAADKEDGASDEEADEGEEGGDEEGEEAVGKGAEAGSSKAAQDVEEEKEDEGAAVGSKGKRGRGKAEAGGKAAKAKPVAKKQRTSKAEAAAVSKVEEKEESVEDAGAEEKKKEESAMEVDVCTKAEVADEGASAAGTSSGAGGSGAGPSQPAKEEECGAAAAAAPPADTFKYALELSTLLHEFPEADSALVRMLLEDQEGDLKDVRFTIRKTLQVDAPKRGGKGKGKAKATPAAE